MRFMLLLKADARTEAGVLPDEKTVSDMMKYNEELVRAGVLLAGEGLQASAKGARVYFAKGGRTVVDGPFPETEELVAGFWMIQVKSKEEAIEWVKRCPSPRAGDAQIEIRQVFEPADFAESIPAELLEREERMRTQVAKQ